MNNRALREGRNSKAVRSRDSDYSVFPGKKKKRDIKQYLESIKTGETEFSKFGKI